MAAASFIGLGNMGMFMAQNLLKNGIELYVYNRTKEKATPLIQQGAQLLDHPKEAFEHSDIVFTMLANDQAVKSVVEGPQGLLETAKRGCIHVNFSTISPALSHELFEKYKAKGADYVAAPVFGRPDVAEHAALWICVAGDESAKRRSAQFLQFIGKKTYDFGEEPSVANHVKLTGNFMILSVVEMLAEAFAFAQKGGVSKETLLSFLTDSIFPSPVFKTYGKMILDKSFTPAGFKMSLGIKDIDLFLRTAEKLQVPAPLAGLLHDRLLASLANSKGDLDWSAIALVASEEAGLEKISH